MMNGYYYNIKGFFDKQVVNGVGDKNDVYIFDTKTIKGVYMNLRKLSLKYPDFVIKGKTVYGESSAYMTNGIDYELSREMFAIASVLKRNKVAYGIDSAPAREFAKAIPIKRNGTKMQLAVGAVINAEIGGRDYSNGATHWDGMEQATAFPASFKGASNGKFESHRNTWGWEISQEHYDKWRQFIGAKFVDAGRIHPATVGRNKGKIRAKSTAVYKGTIFWKVT
ncbi:MAG: hypothetical protein Q3971_06645 [Moraxella sp.]|nr:hypothetical protein [Moraxella sp.]